MMQQKEYRELKEIYSRIIKAIKFQNEFSEIKTIGALDISFSDKNAACAAVVMTYPELEIIEVKTLTTKEPIKYSPTLIAFREGNPLIKTYKLLENKPDLILISKPGSTNPKKVSTPGYVGVLINKPTIGVSKDLVYGHLEEDRIILKEEQRGLAIRTREHARPIFISPGFGVDIETAVNIVKKCTTEFKMPLPLHLAHKYSNKTKKGEI